MVLTGRRKLYTTVENITRDNVVSVLNSVLPLHYANAKEEEYLYWYRRGKAPVLGKTKVTRPEINNIVVQNVAHSIVAFKNGYFLTKPTFYVNRRGKKGLANRRINQLNDYLYLSGKNEADNCLCDWFHTVGVAPLYVEPTKSDDDVPAKAYALDPRDAFAVYSRRPGNEPVMGVHIAIVPAEDEFGNPCSQIVFDAITKEYVFRVSGTKFKEGVDLGLTNSAEALTVESVERNVKWLGEIPIIEYQYDRNRMGAFETVISLCDEVNAEQSRRSDAIESFVNSLLVFYNCRLDVDDNGNTITPQMIREQGAIFLKSIGQDRADLKEISSQLDQTQTQIYLDDLMKQIADIAGVPFTTATMAGTSDNVGAVYLRSGWASADTFARNCEDLFREANKRFDKLFFKILANRAKLEVKASDVDIQFTRNEMENLLVKTQGALNLKQLGFSPELVYEKSGLSNDPSGDVERSRPYVDIAFASEAVMVEQPNEDGDNDA